MTARKPEPRTTRRLAIGQMHVLTAAYVPTDKRVGEWSQSRPVKVQTAGKLYFLATRDEARDLIADLQRALEGED